MKIATGLQDTAFIKFHPRLDVGRHVFSEKIVNIGIAYQKTALMQPTWSRSVYLKDKP